MISEMAKVVEQVLCAPQVIFSSPINNTGLLWWRNFSLRLGRILSLTSKKLIYEPFLIWSLWHYHQSYDLRCLLFNFGSMLIIVLCRRLMFLSFKKTQKTTKKPQPKQTKKTPLNQKTPEEPLPPKKTKNKTKNPHIF